jgi:hypothetical protein
MVENKMLKTRANRLILMVCSFFSFILGSYVLSNLFATLLGKAGEEAIGAFDWLGDLYHALSIGEIGFMFVMILVAVIVFLALAFVSFFVARLLFSWVVKGQ